MKALKAVSQREVNDKAAASHDLDSQKDQDNSEDLDRRNFTVLHSVTSAIRRRSHEIGLHVSPDAALLIDPQFDTIQTMAGPGSTFDFSLFNMKRRNTRALLFLLNRVANLDLKSAQSWSIMYEPSILAMSWRLSQKPPCSWPGDLAPEDLEDLALYHIRAALVSVIVGW